MSLKGASSIDEKLSAAGKALRLNPDAAEFVPFALRSPSAAIGVPDASSSIDNFGVSTPGKSVLDESESNNSDDEAHQFWRHLLPDDIIPDFNVSGEEESHIINTLPFSNLSLADVNGTQRFATSAGSGFRLKEQHESSPRLTNGSTFAKKMVYHTSSYGENPLANFQQHPAKPWDMHGDQLFTGIKNGPSYNGDTGNRNHEQQLENLTIGMLTQLELQVDSGFNQNQNSKVLSAPNLNAMDFPDRQNGVDHQQRINPYHPLFAGATDFSSAVKKLASHESSIWNYNKNPSQDITIGSSRSSHVLASAYNGGHGRLSYGDRLANRNSSRSAPVWLETGDAVANMYSEISGEARDHARLRNVYFEQARHALAKELNVKGQLYNMQMKAAYGKAQESIYHHRNPLSPRTQGNGRGEQERLIDLNGVHVTEAIHVLKRDLTMLRNVARSADECLQVYIRLGTGRNTRGKHVCVKRYLLEDEGLDYSEPKPGSGVLRVVVY
ncbi:polyadenylate-binding protein-interacting protein 7-like [Rutidosis leptorrhynchoides]|uniref:polyadenylate-binding protein-interacting protein 7-like n=1 Tax=Rutidosis leptorrhynchoides TaxID=125765 RepID=UPI003A9999AB